MTKKEKPEKLGNVGSVPISDYEADRLRDVTAQREGVRMLIRTLSELAGDVELKGWKVWESLRDRYDFPDEEEVKVWYEPNTKTIRWRKKVDGV